MDVFIDFLVNNYLWVLIISLILIFALIGYLVDISNQSGKSSKRLTPITPTSDDDAIVHPSVEVYTNDVFDDPLIKDKNAK